MQRVIKSIFFIDDKIENNMKFWALIGPFLLFFTLSLAPFEMTLLTAGCLFLCYRFRFRGLGIAIIALTGYSFYFLSGLEDNHIWNFGLQLSIMLGLAISTYGFDEVKASLEDHSVNNNQEFLDLQGELKDKQNAFVENKKLLEKHFSYLKEEINKKTDRIDTLSEDNENLKKLLEDNQSRKDYLLNELDQKTAEIEKLSIKQDELYEKISFMKDEEFLVEKNKSLMEESENISQSNAKLSTQIEELNKLSKNGVEEKNKLQTQLDEKIKEVHLLNEKMQNFSKTEVDTSKFGNLQNNLTEKESEIKKLKEKLKNKKEVSLEYITDAQLLEQYQLVQNESKHLSSLYTQLKDQFEEKQKILHKTRQELFQTKEKLVAKQRKENEDFNDLSENEKILMHDMNFIQSELNKFKKENQNLEEFVSFLLNKSQAVENTTQQE